MEECFDDLRSAQSLVNECKGSGYDADHDVLEFRQQLTTVMRKFKGAISVMNSSEGKTQVDACLAAYREALDGYDISGKFCTKWGQILETKVGV